MRYVVALFLACLFAAPTVADDSYSLKYKFSPGEKIRWQVTEQVVVKTTMRGTTQVAKTSSASIKVWQVGKISDSGKVTFQHMVESVNMKMWLTGRDEISYNSKTDAEPPEQYKSVAENVARPLSEITMDEHGRVLGRKDLINTPHIASRKIALPLPAEPVKIGDSWTRPLELLVRLRSGAQKTIQARNKFTLLSVDQGIAKIKLETQILTPITDAEIESQIIQRKTSGTAQFDLKQGRFISTELSLDDAVHQFQGADSLMRYKMKFVEKILPSTPDAVDKTTPADASS